MILSPEQIGWVATALTVSSFLFKDTKKIRQVNLVGCLWWIAYGLTKGTIDYPVIFVNSVIAGIHIFYLLKSKSS